MKYAVIGGAGFLGSHLTDYLINSGHEVLVLDNLITGKTKHINPQAKFLWFDIRDSELALAKILEQEKIDYVMNYAAEPYIPVSWERPLHVFNINAVAVLNVLNACQLADIKAVLQVSSAEIYGKANGKITEAEPIEPHSTYGIAKMAADALVQVRFKEAGVPAIAMRQFNCVGERETHEYVIPEIIQQLAIQDEHKAQAVVRLGNNSFRDFQYAGDAVRMAVDLLHNGKYGEVYNMGSEEGIQIYELAELIGKLMGFEQVIVQPDEARIRPWEIWHLQSDNTKLYSAISTRPNINLEEALNRTIKYFYDNGKKWDF